MIGVFDSGNGGLTVLRALEARLPGQAFLYLGDHANAPYGCRSREEILERTRENVERLFAAGCRLVLLACNTAAAVALRRLQQDWLPAAHPDRRILGVLVPMVEAVAGVPWHVQTPAPGAGQPRTVGVFATRQTVESGAYPAEIGKRAPAVRVVQQACPELAARIEDGAPAAAVEALVRAYVADLLRSLDGGRPDAVILGCTHYELVTPLFAATLPAGVDLYRQPELVANSLAAYLERHPRLAGASPAGSRTLLYTTGAPAPASEAASCFLGQPVTYAAWATALERGLSASA